MFFKPGTRRIAVTVFATGMSLLGHAQPQRRAEDFTSQDPTVGGRSEPFQVSHTPYPRINVAIGYKVVEAWPQRPADAVWGAMSSVAVDAADNIWTFNRGNIPVQVYTPAGALVKMWGQGLFRNPHQIRFDKSGHVWIVDNGYSTVTKFTADGMALMTLGVKGEQGTDERHLNQPTDVTVTPGGDVFISDGYGNDRIMHYDKNGKFVKSWGQLGSGPGQFSLPHSIAADSKGRLYVADRNNARVQVFEPNGRYVTEWRDIVTPWAIWITAKDEIYIAGSAPSLWWETPDSRSNGVAGKTQMVVRFDTDGRVRQAWTFPKAASAQQAKPGEVSTFHGIAVGANGDLYLA